METTVKLYSLNFRQAKTYWFTLLAMVAVVLTYQIIGSLFEWALTGSFLTAMQDFRLGVPGMLLQIVAGYALLKWLAKR